jgi:ribosomal protein S18 acetylase RimI-like enzyme
MRIEQAESPEFIPIVRELFVEYFESVGVGFCFQGFTQELAQLPGEYVRPWGRLFLAFDDKDDKQVAGCGALRRIDRETCEMKRFYVRPAFRGKGLGRELIRALIGAARASGYARMRLDTLPSMTAAIALYRALGFREIAPYWANPVQSAVFFELRLQ